ncbi:MAG: hypothetical protein IKH22_07030 [Prevotella sp.]|nr:hypothetical protein [Prevotella sp.]
MDIIIIGRIGEKVIQDIIHNYQENIPEIVLTAKRNIRDIFSAQGYNPNEVVFDVMKI